MLCPSAPILWQGAVYTRMWANGVRQELPSSPVLQRESLDASVSASICSHQVSWSAFTNCSNSGEGRPAGWVSGWGFPSPALEHLADLANKGVNAGLYLLGFSPPAMHKKRWMGEAENLKVEDGSLEEVFKGPGITPTPKRNCWDIAQLSIPRWMALLFLFLFLPLPRVCAHTCACICARMHTRVLVMVHTWTSENNV